MKKTSRMLAAAVAVLALFGLSGCAEVAAKGVVLDDTNAVFSLEQRISVEGMEGLAETIERQKLDKQLIYNDYDEQIPDLTGTWTEANNESPEVQTLLITDRQLNIYEGGQIRWIGSFDAPEVPVKAYDWRSEFLPSSQLPDSTVGSINFSYNDGQLFYVDQTDLGAPRAVFFSQDRKIETPVENAPLMEIDMSVEELCEYTDEVLAGTYLSMEGVENASECDENGYHIISTFPVQYNYTGITTLGGKELDPRDRKALPFKFATDAVYGDVFFEHYVMGLDNRALLYNSSDWPKVFTEYSLEISFPGEISGFSNDGQQLNDNTVVWNYEQVKAAVESGDYSLSAAGRADFKVDPVPILMTIGGVIFLLVLLVYFMWKRFSPKTIVITSYVLAILSPFGLALAIVAKRKSRNHADGGAAATIAVWVTSAVFVFEALVVILLLLLAPQLVQEFFSFLGIGSSAA